MPGFLLCFFILLLLHATREFHFAVANKTGSFGQLIAKPDNQEQRDTDIGSHHAAPVNAVFQERFVVLAESDNQAQHKGEDRTQRLH